MSVQVGIFAHNEEERIAANLKSLPLEDERFIFHILVNGSSDDTARIARELTEGHPSLTVHEFREGGKARTWNRFIHDIAGDADAYIFVDGDARIADGSFDNLLECLKADPSLNIVAAPPLSGRSVETYQRRMREDHGIFGALYIMSGSFVTRIRQRDIRLPLGLIGDDALIGALAKTDLATLTNWRNSRIGFADRAGFYCEELSPLNPGHWMLQYKRLRNYSLRHFQNRMISQVMRTDGPDGLPPTVLELYKRYPEILKLRPRGLATFFDWVALRRIKLQMN